MLLIEILICVLAIVAILATALWWTGQLDKATKAILLVLVTVAAATLSRATYQKFEDWLRSKGFKS